MTSSPSDRATAIDLVTSTLLGRAARLTRLLMRSGAYTLSRTEWGVLSTLTSDGPRRITELAQTEALAQPTITQLVDKLEARGLVARARSGDDGRVVLVEITAAGSKCLAKVRAEIRANMRVALADLPDAELTELVHATETLGAVIEALQPARDG